MRNYRKLNWTEAAARVAATEAAAMEAGPATVGAVLGTLCTALPRGRLPALQLPRSAALFPRWRLILTASRYSVTLYCSWWILEDCTDLHSSSHQVQETDIVASYNSSEAATYLPCLLNNSDMSSFDTFTILVQYSTLLITLTESPRYGLQYYLLGHRCRPL